jgi:hypothetical protein
MTFTITAMLDDTITAGAGAENWNFSALGFDPGTGTTLDFTSTSAVLLRALGGAFEMVSFTRLYVKYVPTLVQAVSTTSMVPYQTAISTTTAPTGGTDLTMYSSLKLHSYATSTAISINPAAMMKQ